MALPQKALYRFPNYTLGATCREWWVIWEFNLTYNETQITLWTCNGGLCGLFFPLNCISLKVCISSNVIEEGCTSHLISWDDILPVGLKSSSLKEYGVLSQIVLKLSDIWLSYPSSTFDICLSLCVIIFLMVLTKVVFLHSLPHT